ncbi:tRNA dimethylallyltransferase [hydrothermal vent metagenome]|uniref:tRNA dimethylallyltransferase n=1 Tax=hydrothermal vent metagenome TaxID=652676 RepID=A0A1W1C1Q1_9ZZZZ
MKTIAILGATASGKTSLSIKLAQEFNAQILSLDSLSIYKEIDIASAKPLVTEREGIKHFGIDELSPNENFSVSLFFDIYKNAYEDTIKKDKNLIIVGGTGFYLKSLLSGLSTKLPISSQTKQQVKNILQNRDEAFDMIERYDKKYAQKISYNDTYRIEKWLELYLQSGMGASEYFAKFKKKPLIEDIDIFEIETSKDILNQRISQRTDEMIKKGLIDEVVWLEKKYTRRPNSMRSIGIKETLEFLDGFIDRDELANKISQNTSRLAKRQRTFNSTQFPPHIKGDLENLYHSIHKSKIFSA